MEYIFEDVLEIKNGKNQKAVENSEGQYPIYGSGGVMGYADDYICDADTVIIGRKGSINNPIYVTERFWNVDTAFGLSAKRELLLPRYLFYFCKKFDFEKLNKTVTIPSLTKSDLLKIKIDLPVISEQQDVVERLSKIEAVIELRKQELSALDDLIQARFIEMFDDPVHNDKGWNTASVESVCKEIFGGGTPSKAHPEYYENGDIPWVSSKDMKTDVLFDSQIRINQMGLDNSTARIVPVNSVIMVIRSGILKHTLPVAINAVPLTINQDLKAFVPGDRIITRFMAMQFKIHEKDILSGVRAVTADNIEFNSLKQRLLIIPPLDLQNEFVEFAKQIDKLKVT